MFLVPIKLRHFKFSLYLILIVLLVPTKKIMHSVLIPVQNLFNLCFNS